MDRRHGGRVCGDMVDTFKVHRQLGNWVSCLLAQVQFLDHLRQKEYFHKAVAFTGTDTDRQAKEGATHTPEFSPVTDLSLLVHLSHFHSRGILHRRQIFGKVALAGLVATQRSFHPQSFMGSLRIVYRTPLIEGLLHMRAIAPAASSKHLDLQGTMETFLFALSLRMVRPTVMDADAKAHQPRVHRRILSGARGAPGRTVVPQDFVWQAVGAKGARQMGLRCGLLLIGAGRQQHVVAGMIVQRAQWMTTALAHRKMAFKVHLPQLIGSRTFKTLKGPGRLALLRPDQAMAMKNPSNGAGGRKIASLQVLQTPSQLARSPGWMHLPQGHDFFFDRRLGSLRTALRPARAVAKAFRSPALKTLQPLVANRRTDTKTPAQLPDIGIGLKGKVHKLKSYMNQVFHRPRHRMDTLPASASMCPPCPRTPVHHVSGPYIPQERENYPPTI